MNKVNERMIIEALATLIPNRKVSGPDVFNITHKILHAITDESIPPLDPEKLLTKVASRRQEYQDLFSKKRKQNGTEKS